MITLYQSIESNSFPDEEIIISYDSKNQPYSRYLDDDWVLLDKDITINFNQLSGEFKKTIKNIIYNLINKKSLRSLKSHLRNLMNSASTFENLIKMSLGKNYGDLDNPQIYNSVIYNAQAQGLRYKTWKNLLLLIPVLKSEGFISRDIGKADDLAKYLAGNTKYSKQTMAIPEKIASVYFSEAIRVVELFHDDRQIISKLYGIFISEINKTSRSEIHIEAAARKVYKKFDKYTHIELDHTGSWLSGIRGACYTVIAAFTGCRDGEIRSLNLTSYEEKKYAGMLIPILKGIDTKPNIGGARRAVSWVTIPAAKKAIELLWDSYQFARVFWAEKVKDLSHPDEKKRYLKNVNALLVNFPAQTAINPKAGRGVIDNSLRIFAYSANYDATLEDVKEFDLINPSRQGELKVGRVLIPHPHAFRRTFAVYLVRNKLASLLDLKYQFKHMNIAMTSWYSNQAHVASYFDMMMDNGLQNEILGENNSYITDTLYYVYNEAETLAGPEGKRILGLRAKSTSAIYLNREEIAQQVKEGRLSIIEHPTGHCTNPRCDRVCDMTICQYKLVTKEKAFELVQIRERLIDKFSSMSDAKVNQPNILSKLYFEIRSIEKSLEEHSILHAKFKADITVSLL